MTPAQFRSWRKSLGLKQKDAAELLGLKKRVIQYYEKGKRDGKSVGIPTTVELACYAISTGIGGFDGTATEPVPEEFRNLPAVVDIQSEDSVGDSDESDAEDDKVEAAE